MTRSDLTQAIGGSAFAGASALLIPVPDEIKQGVIAVAAAGLGWLTTLLLNWLNKRLGGK